MALLALDRTAKGTAGPFGLKGHENWEEWSRLLEERLHSRFEDLYGIMESDTSLWMELDQFPFPDWDEFGLPNGAFKGLEEFERALLHNARESVARDPAGCSWPTRYLPVRKPLARP